MILCWKTALRAFPLASILMPLAPLASATLCAQTLQHLAPADNRHASAESRRTAKRDRVTLHQESGGLVLDVRRIKGIGGTQLRAPARGWPEFVLVRLHDFPVLENFGASTSTAALTCEQRRLEGVPALLECRLDDTRVDVIERERDPFEIRLPKALLEGRSTVQIRWIDQWR